MSVLSLTQVDIKKVLDMKSTIDIVEKAFAEFAGGKVAMPLRPTIAIPERSALVSFMPCYMPGMGALAIKAVDVFKNNRALGLPTIQGIVILFNGENGSVLAVMDGVYVTAIRTGAASGVATKYLARKDSHVVSIFGAGVEGRTHLEAVSEVRDIRTCWVFDTSPAAAESFVADMSTRGGRIPKDVRIASSAKEALERADIVCTVTTSPTPIFDGNDLKPGTHVNAVGSHAPAVRELDTATIVRSKIVCDSASACLAEAGDLLIPISEGRFAADQVHGDLGDLVTGKLFGRTSDGEITLFKSVGLAIEDAATALYAYTSAKEQGIGGQFEL